VQRGGCVLEERRYSGEEVMLVSRWGECIGDYGVER
jgi:hypothetical protein